MIGSLIRRVIPEQFRPIGYLHQLTQKRTGCRVRSGPFEGMRYVANSTGSAYIPKLLGIYERELAPQIEQASALRPGLIVDIGAAEGYYAVGLAMRNPQAHVVAFEMEPWGRSAIQDMAALNGVEERMEVRGKCEATDLSGLLDGSEFPLVVCDVEGYEESLLDPAAVSALAGTRILVELHDFLVPGITQTLKDRFTKTHAIEHVWQEPRSRSDFPWRTCGTRLLPGSYLDWAVSEWRPVRMSWLWMNPFAS